MNLASELIVCDIYKSSESMCMCLRIDLHNYSSTEKEIKLGLCISVIQGCWHILSSLEIIVFYNDNYAFVYSKPAFYFFMDNKIDVRKEAIFNILKMNGNQRLSSSKKSMLKFLI